MSVEALNAVLERAMGDAAFREQLATDPQRALSGYDLTEEERSRFTSAGSLVERLEERVSKSDLSAAFGGKTASANLRTPSESRRR